MTVYKGYDIFNFEPNWVDMPLHEFNRPSELMRFLGLSYAQSYYDETALRFRFSFLEMTKSLIRQINDFFDGKLGRLQGFWIPSWQADIVVTEPFDAAANLLNIQDIKYEEYWLCNEVTGRHIFMMFPDREYVCKKIIGVPSSTMITLDSTVGKACSASDLSALLVSFLYFMRFDQDEIETKYASPEVGEMQLSFKTIPDGFTTTTTTTTT